MRLPLALAAAAATLLTPGVAAAATVTTTQATIRLRPDLEHRYAVVAVTAAPGERNELVVGQLASGELRVRDAGAPLTAGAGCRAVSAGEVVCAGDLPIERVSADLGDGDDRGVIAHEGAPPTGPHPSYGGDRLPVTVRGGAGADALTAGPGTLDGGDGNDLIQGTTGSLIVDAGAGDDVVAGPGGAWRGGDGDDRMTMGDAGGQLAGGPGDDVLTAGAARNGLDGGGGRDTLTAGAGDDTLTDGDGPGYGGPAAIQPVDADVLDGGDGTDLVTLSSRQRPLDVDLRREAGNGERGEGDTLRGLESIGGGRGADRLTGTDGPNQVYADAADVVRTLGGDDLVSTGGRTGGGRVDLGAGDDRATGVVYGARPAYACGPGTDHIDRAQAVRRVPADCERLGYGSAHDLVHPALALRGATVTGPRLACGALRRTPRFACRARLRLQLGAAPGGVRLGSSRTVTAPLDGTAALPVRLGAYARGLLARRGRLTVRVTLERQTDQGRRYPLGSYTATLRR